MPNPIHHPHHHIHHQMASFNYFLLSSLLFFISFSVPVAPQSFRPKALVIPVSKDASTLQYVTTIYQRTPSVPIDLVLDLGGQFLWVDCDKNYASSTYQPARCRSAQCSLARANGCGDCFAGPKPGCNNNTCGVSPDNSVTRTATGGEVAQDVVSVDSTNGSNPGRVVSVPKFLFSCGSTFLLEGLASGVVGMAGLGRTKIALPSQFAAAFSFNRKFAICLTSSSNSKGGSGANWVEEKRRVGEGLGYVNSGEETVGTISEKHDAKKTQVQVVQKEWRQPLAANISSDSFLSTQIS